jgi:type I restriction enzyme S subunit
MSSRAPIGHLAIAGCDLYTNQGCKSFVCSDSLDPEFLYFTLKHQMHAIQALGSGATFVEVSKSALQDFEITFPSIGSQLRIAARLKDQHAAVVCARNAANIQLDELVNLANTIIRQSVEHPETDSTKLGDVLDEVKKGIGKTWSDYPVLGATRAGLALAKDPVGKSPERYKPIMCGTVFYNPMRIMIGSIAMVDENDTPGITSPDYVALRGKPGMVDSRWFYYWLRSPYGVSCIASLARGAVRERMLFNRLTEGSIELPPYDVQVAASKALAELKPMRSAIEKQLNEINLLPAKILAQAFDAAE